MNIENLKDEIWMCHPKYTDYAASNYGRIKSIERDVNGKCGSTRHLQEQLIKLGQDKDGYLQFSVCENGKIINYRVHRFVWECFNQVIIPKDIKKYQINHINEVKTNNQIFNLSLVSAKENNNYGTRTERIAESRSKAVGQYELNGELVKIWKSTQEAEREGGFQHSAVSQCCNNKFNREGNNIYKKFKWKYYE